MTTPKFKIGDIVELKTGGPKMTIEGFKPVKTFIYVDCVWFEENNNKPYRSGFNQDTIILYNPSTQ